MNRLKRLLALCFLLGLTAAGASQVQAEGVVGSGTPGSCTEAALDAALNGGGTVIFNCGSSPHTIILTSQKSINDDTTIEGGNLIILSGANSTRLFDVGAVLTLRDIVLANGYFNGDGGAIRNNANGTLALDNVTLQNSTATLSGGAIVSYGPLNILDSNLTGNTALNGGALYLRFSGSQTTIVNSNLTDNQANGINEAHGLGGVILLWDGAHASIQGSDIDDNTGVNGGAVYITEDASLLLEDSSMSGNKSLDGSGGGIYNRGTVTLTRVTFDGNSTTSDKNGGGLYNEFGLALLTDVTFSNNQSEDGGGMANYNSTAYLTNLTFRDNKAIGGNGGGLIDNYSLTNLVNVTFSNNLASFSGGGYYSRGSIAALTNVTFFGNAAQSGGGIVYSEVDIGDSLTLKNTIVGDSTMGGDCDVYQNNGEITSAGFNISSDRTCNEYFDHPSDQTNIDLLLGPLAANGGYTWTHIPQAGSPAIDEGQCLAQISTDQRGISRPQGPACDIGAVERKEMENVVYLPLVVR